jgi:hypothetical protein
MYFRFTNSKTSEFLRDCKRVLGVSLRKEEKRSLRALGVEEGLRPHLSAAEGLSIRSTAKSNRVGRGLRFLYIRAFKRAALGTGGLPSLHAVVFHGEQSKLSNKISYFLSGLISKRYSAESSIFC